MDEFKANEIICQENCRFGLTAKMKKCKHLQKSKISHWAKELANYETGEVTPTQLCKSLEIYVDDPDFWESAMINSKSRILHIEDIFVTTAKHQLLRLSGSKLGKTEKALFLKRIEQLLDINSKSPIYGLEEDLQYYFFNLQRKKDTDFVLRTSYWFTKMPEYMNKMYNSMYNIIEKQ